MMNELTLADLAVITGVGQRTIRSWIAQDLLPAPLNRGPTARYPAEMVLRIKAIRVMREMLGFSLLDIRRELLSASPDKVAQYARRADKLPVVREPSDEPLSRDDSAADYLARLRVSEMSRSRSGVRSSSSSAGSSGRQGFEALRDQLGHDRASPARKARGEEWLHIPITRDVELRVRGPCSPDQQATLENCADLIRDILLNGR